MWICKYCSVEFPFSTTNEKCNHSRWCEKNPKRDEWNKGAFAIKVFGDFKDYEVECAYCQGKFLVKEREKLFPQNKKYFHRPCARKVAAEVMHQKYYAATGKHAYRTQAWKFHKKECIVCGETKIVAVHHYDEDHANKSKENLIPLCPTHHGYVHSKYRDEVMPIIESFRKKIGV